MKKDIYTNQAACQITAIHPYLKYLMANGSNITIDTTPTPPAEELVIKPKRPHPLNGTVDPIRSDEDLQAAKDYFLGTSLRDHTMFIVGCNCAKRIGDILNFHIGDFINEDGSFKESFRIKEQKTGKSAKILIIEAMKEAVMLYLNSLPSYEFSDYLFSSQKKNNGNLPITTRAACKIMKEMSIAIGLDKKGLNIGTHTMRKTWAYRALRSNPTDPETIALICEILNHSSEKITRRYCGLTQDSMDNFIRNNAV